MQNCWYIRKIRRGGWSGFGMAWLWDGTKLIPIDLGLIPKYCPFFPIGSQSRGVVQFCLYFSLCASTISFKSTIFSWWWWLYFSTASKGFSLNLYLTFRRVLRMNPHQALSTKPLSNFLEYTIPLSSVCLFHFSACISQTRALQCIALHYHMAWAPEGREGQS